ncbi:hypothetical protein [Prevotella sp. P5-64]|uniref:hypothetical protein n=1 Tax=Prevotella sp. P5-64 TaxID=2024226 RepID=UPI000B9607AB|nr:hypothetical protein [Prevotella sp. P5-64]OYP70501.1 hypothetical protein CIK87_02570 [Prevotella sp. P5-64]
MQIVLNYNFDGENLAIDAFRLVRDNPEAATRITASVDEPITFISRCQGEPTKTIWTLPGSENNEYAGNSVTVTYPQRGHLRRHPYHKSQEREGCEGNQAVCRNHR